MNADIPCPRCGASALYATPGRLVNHLATHHLIVPLVASQEAQRAFQGVPHYPSEVGSVSIRPARREGRPCPRPGCGALILRVERCEEFRIVRYRWGCASGHSAFIANDAPDIGRPVEPWGHRTGIHAGEKAREIGRASCRERV